jgi:chemotaxis signal transduction protein
MKVVIFVIGSTEIAIPENYVDDIFILSHITRVPVAPPFMGWIGNWKGAIIPIIDLAPFVSEKLKAVVGQKIGMAIKPSVKDSTFALVIDRIICVATIDEMPSHGEVPVFVENIAMRNGTRLWILSPPLLEKMLIHYLENIR